MTFLIDIARDAPRMIVNLAVGGACAATGLAIAARMGDGVRARVRHRTALAAFLLAIALPLTLGMVRAPEKASALFSPSAEPGTTSRVLISTKAQATAAVAASSRPVPASALAILWAAGTLLLLIREIAGHAAISRQGRRWTIAQPDVRARVSCPNDVRLAISDDEGPAVVGILRPTIVLPRSFIDYARPSTLHCVMRHEIAHVRHRDTIENAFVRLLKALFWISPGLWWIDRILRTEREAAADERAAGSRLDERADYATELVSAACWSRSRGSEWMLASGWGCDAKARVQRLLDQCERRAWRPGSALVLTAGFFLAAATPLITAPRGSPPPIAVPGGADASYREAAGALNRIIARTEPRNHVIDAAALDDLGAFRRAGNLAPLADALTNADSRLRETAAWFAGELGDRRMVQSLILCLGDGDPHAAHAAAWALGRIGDPASIPALLLATTDRRADVRQGAAWALGKMRATQAAERLILLRSDRDEDVRQAASWSLERLATG